MANLKDINYGIGKYLVLSDASDIPDIGANRKNLDLLNFKVATNNAYALYNFKDGMIDAYQTQAGVDTTTSTNEDYNSSGNYYQGIGPGNYFGDDSDGALSTSGNVTYTVQNASGYDGDVVLKQYTNLTINAGHTVTVNDNCRGLFIYVSGNLVLNGTISMDGKGADADPASAGASDNAVVNASGLQLPMFTDSGSSTLAAATFAGTGTALVAAVANQPAISSDGTIFSLARIGGTGGAVKSDTGGYAAGNHGTAGVTSGTTALALTGGGGGGAAHFAHSGAGGDGTCFTGGSAGGASQGPQPGPYPTGNDGSDVGAAGGAGTATGSAHGPQGAGGGAGQPGGAVAGGSGAGAGNTGNGGVIWIIVKGNISGSGTITADGTNGGNGASTNGPAGGGSGAGGCIILCAGSDSSSYTNGMGGGSGGTGGQAHGNGGNGGAGGLVINSTLTTEGPVANMTIVSNTQIAQADPTEGRLMLYEEDVDAVTLDTDIKGYVSRDGGTTYTQTLLTEDTVYDRFGIDSNTKLMLHCDGSNDGTTFTDSTYNNRSAHVVTANGDVHTDTAIKKFGTASAQFDGTGDYLSIPDSDDWDIGTNWTVDFWAYNSASENDNYILNHSTDASNLWGIKMKTNCAPQFFIQVSGSNIVDITAATDSGRADAWHHYAIVKSGDDWVWYVDGTSSATLTDTSDDPGFSGSLYLGRNYASATGQNFTGYLDEVRISNVARWTANFTTSLVAYGNPSRFLSGSVDISGQPAGSNMKYKVETLNSKNLRLHGASLLWA